MIKTQPYFRLNKKHLFLEVVNPPHPITKEEVQIIEKLLQRDFKTALLHRRSSNKGIATLADDIIIQRG